MEGPEPSRAADARKGRPRSREGSGAAVVLWRSYAARRLAGGSLNWIVAIAVPWRADHEDDLNVSPHRPRALAEWSESALVRPLVPHLPPSVPQLASDS